MAMEFVSEPIVLGERDIYGRPQSTRSSDVRKATSDCPVCGLWRIRDKYFTSGGRFYYECQKGHQWTTTGSRLLMVSHKDGKHVAIVFGDYLER